MKSCARCSIEKEDSEFPVKRRICKQCNHRRIRIWARNKARGLKIRAAEYLGSKCCICGYNKCIYVLEFAHQAEKGKKEFEPTDMFQKLMPWNVIQKELDKCLLKCANCHREETAEKIFTSGQ